MCYKCNFLGANINHGTFTFSNGFDNPIKNAQRENMTFDEKKDVEISYIDAEFHKDQWQGVKLTHIPTGMYIIADISMKKFHCKKTWEDVFSQLEHVVRWTKYFEKRNEQARHKSTRADKS